MGKLVDRACRSLGDRLGRRFLQYAGPLSPDEATRLLLRIDEHLARVHRVELGAVELANRVALACKMLLRQYQSADEEAQTVIRAAARYFIETYDLDDDLASEDGLADDVQVLNFAIELSGLNVPPVVT